MSSNTRDEMSLLLAALKQHLAHLSDLLDRVNGEWVYEDRLYRFYHYSFKVYDLQGYTSEIVAALKALAPHREIDPLFAEILASGTGIAWKPEHNRLWPQVTRPIVEAFLHAKYFLEMAVKYGRELDTPPNILPSGWAALLSLYGLR